MAAKVILECLTGCAGCEIAILDQGENLLNILEKVDIVHAPILMDHKLYNPSGDSSGANIPDADIGIISGAIRTEENLELAQIMREKCSVIIANGACACTGGIPAIANVIPPDVLKEGIYPEELPAQDGKSGLPPFTNRVIALNEVINVDIFLPGCPPTTKMFSDALTAALEGRPYEPPADTVCNECIRNKEKRTLAEENGLAFPEMLRPLGPAQLEKRCFIEQGYFCMGAATRSGCEARCIKAGVPCRGCMGTRRVGENPRAEMLGALSFYGYALRDVYDRRAAFNWFTGAHNNLRPIR